MIHVEGTNNPRGRNCEGERKKKEVVYVKRTSHAIIIQQVSFNEFLGNVYPADSHVVRLALWQEG